MGKLLRLNSRTHFSSWALLGLSPDLTSFLTNLVKDGKMRSAESDDIIRDTLLTQGGEVVNARVRESLGMPALAVVSG